MAGPRPQFPPVYNEMDRSVSEGPSLGRYFGLVDFIFYIPGSSSFQNSLYQVLGIRETKY